MTEHRSGMAGGQDKKKKVESLRGSGSLLGETGVLAYCHIGPFCSADTWKPPALQTEPFLHIRLLETVV